MAEQVRAMGDILRTAADGVSWALTTIPFEHHEIHDGSAFVASGTADLASGGTIQALIKTPAGTKFAHAALEVITEAEAAFNFYEGYVVGAAGTVGTNVAAQNRNRNSSGTATTLIYTGPSVGTAAGTIGTLIYASHWNASKGPNIERGVSEWVLKPNTQYLLEVVNATAAANYTAWAVNWYEHTNKE